MVDGREITLKIIDRITHLGGRRMHVYEDKVTEKIPYFAVAIFIGMISYVILDYFLVVR